MLFRRKVKREKVERFEVIIPLYYKDKARVEQYKIDDTLEELGKVFGGYTEEPVRVSGFWLDKEGNPHYDESLRVRIDIPCSEKNRDHFLFYKRILKIRFDQLDIWITVHEVEIL